MLNELMLGNFKAFQEQSIALRPLTLLAGINGMGKSSVLQSLLVLRQSFQQNVLPNIGLALNGEYVELGRGRDVLFENAGTDDIYIGLRADEGNADWHFAYDNASDTLRLKDQPDTTDYGAFSLFATPFYYLNAERIGPRNLLPVSDYLVGAQRQIGIHGEYVGYYLALFGSERIPDAALYHPLTKQESPTLRSLVGNWLSEISPNTHFDVTAIEGVDMVRLTFGFERSEIPTRQYRATNVGFGISYSLPIIVALLAAKPGTLVMIENPEAHLHPRGQLKMGELVARAASIGTQVIMETHSDHVLNGIRLAVKAGIVPPEEVALHFFQRPEDDDGTAGVEVVTPELDSDGRIDYWPDGFFDEYGKALRGLL